VSRFRPDARSAGLIVARPAQRKAKRPARAARGRPTPRRGAGASFAAEAAAALKRGEPDAISDEVLRQTFAAAVKLYAAKAERRGAELPPFKDGAVTATETVVAACALIRAADLNPFDVAMWFHRERTVL
jgi:hypothetical protein